MEDAKAAVGKTLKYTISNGFMLASGSVGFDWLLAFCLLFFLQSQPQIFLFYYVFV